MELAKKRIEKLVIAGDFVEYYRYYTPITADVKSEKSIFSFPLFESEIKEKRPDNLRRAQRDIRHLIWTNQTPYTKFLTLTYKDTVLDQKTVVDDFKRFLKNMKNNGYHIKKWLYVTEHQKERGEREGNAGCLHIHALLFDDRKIPIEILRKAWNRGFVKINAVQKVKNLGAYVCKYLTKEEFEGYYKNSYHVSRGISRPIVMTEEGYFGSYNENFQKYILNRMEPLWSDVINFEVNGYHYQISYIHGRFIDEDKRKGCVDGILLPDGTST